MGLFTDLNWGGRQSAAPRRAGAPLHSRFEETIVPRRVRARERDGVGRAAGVFTHWLDVMPSLYCNRKPDDVVGDHEMLAKPGAAAIPPGLLRGNAATTYSR